MRRSLLIDDVRDIGATVVARNYSDGIKALQEEGPFDILYLDHDLASYDYSGGKIRELTGYDVMCWLEQNTKFLPGEICCVSSNPIGRQRIQQVINKLYEDVNKHT